MAKWVITFILLSALAVLQAGLGQFSWALGLNLLLFFTAATAQTQDLKQVLIIAFISGMLLDFYSGLTDGVFIVSMLLAAIAVYVLAHAFLSPYSDRLIAFLTAIVAVLVFNLSGVLVNWMFNVFNVGSQIDLNFILLQKLMLDFVSSLVLIYPMIWLNQFRLFLILKYSKKYEPV